MKRDHSELACEELRKFQEEEEEEEAGPSTMESSLFAAQKEDDAAKTSKRQALYVVKVFNIEHALKENNVD